MTTRPGLRRASRYAFAAGLSLVIIAVVTRAWEADLRYPMNETAGDFVAYCATVFKSSVDNPWYSFNPHLGAPTGLDLADFPSPDLLLLLWIKLASVFTHRAVLIDNVTYLVEFPLVTVVALHCLMRMGVRYVVALAAGTLFAFLTFHFLRAMQHPFLAFGYFSVPLATLLAVEIATGRELLLRAGTAWWRPRVLGTRRSLAAVAVAAVIGLSGLVYFTFFSAALIGCAGVLGAARTGARDLRAALPLARAAALLAVVGVAFTVNVAPSLLYFHEHGKTTILDRQPADAEFYGLKLTELVFPTTGHRSETLARWKERYDRTAPLVNENVTEYVGAFGVVGFTYLVVTLLFARRREAPEGEPGDLVDDPEAMHALRVLNLVALALGTVGGVGAIFAYVVSPQIRSYNRISVYVAFFSLAALAILVERAVRRARRPVLVRRALPPAMAAVMGLGVWDQAPASHPAYARLKERFLEDDSFVREVEASVPAGSEIFQLPFAPFPEGGDLGKLPDYALFLPYLHSSSLRWTYGAMRGRRAEKWNRDLARLPAAEMVDALALAGFGGIYVSRDGYGDHGAAVEAGLTGLLGGPLASRTSADAFFSLAPRARELRATLGDAEVALRRDAVRGPFFLGWLEGFTPPADDAGSSVWCGPRGRFVIDNPSGAPKKVMLDALVVSAAVAADVHFSGDLLDRVVPATRAGARLLVELDVAPGEHFVRLETDGAPRARPGDLGDHSIELRSPRLVDPR